MTSEWKPSEPAARGFGAPELFRASRNTTCRYFVVTRMRFAWTWIYPEMNGKFRGFSRKQTKEPKKSGMRPAGRFHDLCKERPEVPFEKNVSCAGVNHPEGPGISRERIRPINRVWWWQKQTNDDKYLQTGGFDSLKAGNTAYFAAAMP